jgi:hypothetical protein
MSFRPFCVVCGTERRSSSSNRNFEFDYCINCKKTTSFAAERTLPSRLVAADLAAIEADEPLPTLRFDIAREHASLFDTDTELTQLARNGVGGAVSVPVLTDARLHSGSFVVEFVVSGADKGAGVDVGFGLVWNVGVQLTDRLGGSPTTWALDPVAGTIRNNDKVILADDQLRLLDGRGHVQLHLQLPRATEAPGSATFMVQQSGEQTCIPSVSIPLPASAVLVAAASTTARGQRLAVSVRRNSLEEG